MLRLTVVRCLSKNVGNGVDGWAAHRPKQNFRLSSPALQRSRQRFQIQKDNFALQQSLNQQFGEEQKNKARRRTSLEQAAYGLAHGNSKQRRLAQNKENVYVRPQERADVMAAARHLLMLKEATRKEMKRGRGRRVETFRSLKRR